MPLFFCTPAWNVSQVETMKHMFLGADSFNGDVITWDVSKVASMKRMFYAASSFNSDVSNWDLQGARDMIMMFARADSFNQDISSWNVRCQHVFLWKLAYQSSLLTNDATSGSTKTILRSYQYPIGSKCSDHELYVCRCRKI